MLKDVLRVYPETDLALLALLDSEIEGDGGRNALGVLNGERARLNDGLVGVTGPSTTTVELARRCREA